MIPTTGDITIDMVKNELGITTNNDINLGHQDIRLLAGKNQQEDISLGDLRGKSTGRNMKRISVSVRYNNGSNSNGSRIGIKSIYVYDWKGNEIKNKFSWRFVKVHERKSNVVTGGVKEAIDNNDNTEVYAYNSSSGDANYCFEIAGESSIDVKVKRIRVVWGEFKYSSGHDGSRANIISNGAATSDGWPHNNPGKGKLDYDFYHHRGGSPQPPTADIIYND